MRKQRAKMTNKNIYRYIDIQINTNQKKTLVSLLIFYKVNFRTKKYHVFTKDKKFYFIMIKQLIHKKNNNSKSYVLNNRA